MAANYWHRDWFESGYFPEVWFAPADETDVPDGELRGGGYVAPVRRPQHEPWRPREDDEALLLCGLI